jgi:4-hydroxy-4-methyl-2-oxoglutarate aldolase
MMSLASRNQGSQGAVINGGTRDTAQVLGMDFPVFARFRSPASSIGRWEIIEWQKSIRIGTVTINPGDYVFGDIDGVVVIPQEMTVEVLLEGEKLFTTERKMQEALRGGMTIRAAYEKFGTF